MFLFPKSLIDCDSDFVFLECKLAKKEILENKSI
jgi:hypothetical protein